MLILNWVISVFHTNFKPNPPTLPQPQTHPNPNWTGKIWKWAITSNRRKKKKVAFGILIFFFFAIHYFVNICYLFLISNLFFVIAKLSPAQAQAWGWDGYISIVTTTHPVIHPPIRISLNLASDNITSKSKVAYLFGWAYKCFWISP